MIFELKRVSDYASCQLCIDNFNVDIGLINRDEALKLLERFKSAVDDLEWFIRVTEK